MKRKVLLSILVACILLMAGCGQTAKTLTVDEFKSIQGDTYDSYKKIAEKYGPYKMEYSEEYTESGERIEASVISDDNYLYVNSKSGLVYIYDGSDWYRKLPEDEATTFSKVIAFEDAEIGLYDYRDLVGYDFETDPEVELTKTDSGYDYLAVYDDNDEAFGDCTIECKLHFNQDDSMKDCSIVYKNADGDIYKQECKYTYKQSMPDLVENLKNELKASNGEERRVTYHYVENGEVIKSFEGVVPKGFLCNAIFPDEYESENNLLCIDKELTIPVNLTPEDAMMDIEVYMGKN